ncbi:heavy metal translocating P-type ATPase [Demequina capsici]|uniref:Heavy metal translocating P-type ATPase n=1 Tax=Demequina capsici TaxID=3075620 RepID=A0AA96FAD3_9MICO|nr:heavy metal translocating P-type ATPase [Demequina sp. PMTSA13]WNM26514.1 heavy metal translocating P-type ATPase [Demequina sp. PMTSA13]
MQHDAEQHAHAGHAMPDHEGHAGHTNHGGHTDHAGHADHAGHVEMFRRYFWWNLMLAVPVIASSTTVEGWFGYDLPLSGWIPPILGTVIFVWGGRPFLTMAWRDEITARSPGMMTLISLAITVAFCASLATTFGVADLDFWWELAALIVVMLLGHWQEMKAVGQAQGALQALAQLLPDDADRVVGELTERVPVSDLAEGDAVIVRPGGRVPADGRIVSGEAAVDESMVTGESEPVRRGEGARVVAGTVATDGSLRIEVTAVGEATALAGIQRMVSQAQESRSGTRRLADRAAAWLFYVALATALLTFVVHLVMGDPGGGLVSAISVLVVACPHALGLAIPLVVAISTSTAARQGILIKDAGALESMRLIDAVLFDKTGTLTQGAPRVTGMTVIDGWDEARLLAVAAAAESESEHPVGRAVMAAADEADVRVPRASQVSTLPGRGVTATVDGDRVAVGGPALLEELGVSEPQAVAVPTAEWRQAGASVLYVVVGQAVVGAFTTADPIRDESRATVEALHRGGVSVALITGDSRAVAESVAGELGIDEVFAEVLPEDKDQAVGDLQAEGHRVAMVGDGVNDAPALARADVGVAIGAGTDVAMEAAGLVLASSDPRGVLGAIALSRATYRKMRQNLAWATGYNVVAIPVAAGVLAPIGVTMPPAIAAVAMSLSTIIVAANAQLLRRVSLAPEDVAR